MPIELPELDDKSYAELVREAHASLSGLSPDWTDHNASDPGIALVELLAWLTEMLIYRTGRIPEPNVRTFLKLLDDRDDKELDARPLDEAIASTMGKLREHWRAVTPEDYEQLAMERQGSALKRVRCLPERDLVRLLVVPEGASAGQPWIDPSPELLADLEGFFRERQIISTRLRVTGPTYVEISLSATLHLRDDADPAKVAPAAKQALFAWFHPWTGGPNGQGWPFGRGVQASEVYARLDGVEGVEFVDKVSLVAPGVDDKGMVLPLRPHELPRVREASINLTCMEPGAGG